MIGNTENIQSKVLHISYKKTLKCTIIKVIFVSIKIYKVFYTLYVGIESLDIEFVSRGINLLTIHE